MKRTPIRRVSVAQRQRSQSWSVFRRAVVVRDGSRCLVCGWFVNPESAEIHHRLPKSRGGKDEHPNAITLCRKHHVPLVHAEPAWATAVGFTVPSGVDPSVWPVLRFTESAPEGLWAVPDAAGQWIVTAPAEGQYEAARPGVAS